MRCLDRFFYKVYTAAYPTALRRKSKFTMGSLVISLFIVLAVIFGLNIYAGVVYQLLALLCSLLLVSFGASFFFPVKLEVQRYLPPFATCGEKCIYKVRVNNLSSRGQADLSYQEVPVIKYPGFEEFVVSREPYEAQRNWWDRMVRAYRFNWLMGQVNKITPKEQPLPMISGNSYITTYVELMPLRRGYVELAGVAVKRRDPFGLCKAQLHLPMQERLLILPKRYELPEITLPGSRKHHTGGVTLASSVGNADEFHSLREYRPGDPMRRLHWKSVAKTGELIIRENEDEYFTRHGLVLDTFAVEPTINRFEVVVSIAASLACTVRTQESLLDLMFVEEKAYLFSTGRGIGQTGKMLEILACVSPCNDKSCSALLPLVARHAQRLSGCVCILQTWDDERQELIQSLKAHKIPMKIVVVTEGENIAVDPQLDMQVIDANNPEQGLALL